MKSRRATWNYLNESEGNTWHKHFRFVSLSRSPLVSLRRNEDNIDTNFQCRKFERSQSGTAVGTESASPTLGSD